MPVIIVSQYPDVEIEEDFIRLEDAAAVLSKRYRVRVIGAVGFNFQSRLWEKELRKVLAVA